MMSDDITLSDDERAFEDYLDSLSGALQHGSRERPFRDYCTGLLLPDGRKSVEPMAARLAPSSTRTTHKRLSCRMGRGATRPCWRPGAPRSPRRLGATAPACAGPATTPGWPIKASTP